MTTKNINTAFIKLKSINELEEITTLEDGNLLFEDGDGKLKRMTTAIFYQLLHNIAKPISPLDAGPFTANTWHKPTIYSASPGTNYPSAGSLKAIEGYDTLFFYNGTSWIKEANKLPGVDVAEAFDPTDAVKAQGGEQINNWFMGSDDIITTSSKTFEGTLITSYPTGFYDPSGVLVNDTSRRRTGYLTLPVHTNTIDFINWNAAYRGVFLSATNITLGIFLTNNNTPIAVPSGAVKIDIGIKSTSVEVDLNVIKINYHIVIPGEVKKIVSPVELENRIDLRETSQNTNYGFSQYSNFDSFTSGYIDAAGLIQPDPTNARKLSPQIDISQYTKFTSHVSINGAYYRLTDSLGSLIKFGLLGPDIQIPAGSKFIQFTIKGSASQVNLASDYFTFTIGNEIDYILKKSDISSFSSQINLYVQISKANSIGSTNIDQWENFSDGFDPNNVTLFDGGIKLIDNITAVNNQAKIRSLKFDFGNVFSVFMKVKFMQLNNSYNMDILDGIINQYGETNNTNDDNINKSGFSFAVIHPTLSVRPIFSIVKSIDYDTSGNLEIWRIIKPTNFVAGFERIWTGKDIPMNAFFDMQIDFEFNTETNANYYVSITVNGQKLVNRSLMGMNSNYAGNKSLLFQCKGTTEEPAEFIVKNIKVVQENKDKANLLGYLISGI
ncbi:hypothetical protein ACTJIV_15655 [Chryseobacterium sp. 22532]|uniref:hypothetical protein n=1 Tax=Chryseobacterium sp. 22532 TaxID=3453938 RepID=UPI003F85A36F